jgi:hypothetical protein
MRAMNPHEMAETRGKLVRHAHEMAETRGMAPSFWMATEYMPPKSSQTTTGRRPWGTRVLALALE